jgi:alkylation response protein AidB-like acyl-CoA dehydrogenase
MARKRSAEVPAEAGHRRMDRLLRPDRARPRLRPGRHEDARQDRDGGYVLNGAKMWITNAPIADVFVVWAKSDARRQDPRLRARKGHEGLRRPKIEGKLSLRASITGEIVMDDVFVPEDALLPNVRAEGPFGCLNRRATASPGARWARRVLLARGAPVHGLDRKQFGRPLAAEPAHPEEARRHADRDRARPAGCLRVGRLMDEGQCRARDDLASSATTAARRSTSPARARHAWRQRHPGRIPRHAPHA